MTRTFALLAWVPILAVVAACNGAGSSDVLPDDIDATDAADAADATDATDDGPHGCLGGTPAASLKTIPHGVGSEPAGACEDYPWIVTQSLVPLPTGGWLAYGHVPSCCEQDRTLEELVRLDPSGNLLAKRYFVYDSRTMQVSVPSRLLALGDGAVLVMFHYPDYVIGLEYAITLDGVDAELGSPWSISAEDLGNPILIRPVARPGSSHQYFIVTTMPTGSLPATDRFLDLAPDGRFAWGQELPADFLGASSTIRTEPDRWWVATQSDQMDHSKFTSRIVGMEFSWDGTLLSRSEAGPIDWESSYDCPETAFWLDPPSEGQVHWFPQPETAGVAGCTYQAWRIPFDGRPPSRVSWTRPYPEIGLPDRPFITARALPDGSIRLLANLLVAEHQIRPMQVTYPAGGGAPRMDGPAFDDAWTGRADWTATAYHPLADGFLVHANLWPPYREQDLQREPTLGIARYRSDGTLRWARTYGLERWTEYPLPVIGDWRFLNVQGGASPFQCGNNEFTFESPMILAFDGICD